MKDDDLQIFDSLPDDAGDRLAGGTVGMGETNSRSRPGLRRDQGPPAPSIRAASSRSFGKEEKKPANSMINSICL